MFNLYLIYCYLFYYHTSRKELAATHDNLFFSDASIDYLFDSSKRLIFIQIRMRLIYMAFSLAFT